MSSLTNDIISADVAAFQKIIDSVDEAISNHKTIALKYKDASGKVSSREIVPFEVSSDARILAWCLKRKGFRSFKIGQVMDIEVTDNSFNPDDYKKDGPKEENKPSDNSEKVIPDFLK